MRGSPRERTLVPRGIWQEIVVLLRRCRGGGFGVAPPPGVRKKSAHPWVSSLHSAGAEDSRPDGTQRGTALTNLRTSFEMYKRHGLARWKLGSARSQGACEAKTRSR